MRLIARRDFFSASLGPQGQGMTFEAEPVIAKHLIDNGLATAADPIDGTALDNDPKNIFDDLANNSGPVDDKKGANGHKRKQPARRRSRAKKAVSNGN